jgi:hypothetical protein
MRFSTQPHHFSCGIDLHARTMYVCILNRDGEIGGHRHMKASPDALLKALPPIARLSSSRSNGLFTWYWLADLCAQAGMAFQE